MSRRVSRPVALLAALGLVLALAAVVLGYVATQRAGQLEEAARLLPDKTLRVAWTDWAGVREELDAGDVPGGGEQTEAFVTAATDRDLASASPTAVQASPLQETFGFSPVTSEWELLGQSRDGMVLIYRLSDDADLADIGDRAEDLGFTRPGKDAMAGAVWRGGPDVITNAENLSAPELQHLAFLEDEHLLVASDNAEYLASAVPFAHGDKDGLDLSALTESVKDPLSAIALASDYACEALSMSAADEGSQATAERLIDEVGGVSPLTGYLAALGPEGAITLVFDFETDEQADEDARARGALAAAEDPGQMLAYPELFEVGEARSDGDAAVVTGTVVSDSFPLSNVTHGPVLLAAC